MRVLAILLAAGCTLGMTGSGSAVQAGFSSVYTPLDLDKCDKVDEDEVGGTYACIGHHDMPMLALDGDARMALSYGRNAGEEPAAKVFFAPLNGPGRKIEWRTGPGSDEPFATIVRWRLMIDEKPTGILVVTRLPPGPVCHVAYIDAAANPDANDLARKVADERARTFRCGEQKPAVVGKPGRGTGALGVETAGE